MAWRRPGDKPLSYPMMAQVGDIYASLGLNEINKHQVHMYSPVCGSSAA